MKKNSVIMLLSVAVLLLFGLACSAASAVGYVTTQGWVSAAGPQPTSAAAPADEPPAAVLPDTGAASAEEAGELDGSEAPAGAAESAEGGESRTEYYRAVYDVCMYSAKEAGIARENAVQACHEFVRRSMDGKWFETPSQGWEWPVPVGGLPVEGA